MVVTQPHDQQHTYTCTVHPRVFCVPVPFTQIAAARPLIYGHTFISYKEFDFGIRRIERSIFSVLHPCFTPATSTHTCGARVNNIQNK